jgi:SAM-dependent methyltransferase
MRVLIYLAIIRPFCYMSLFWLKYVAPRRTFSFNAKRYRYFYDRQGLTHLHERAVEIPIAQDLVAEYGGKKILEIGNVLSKYTDFAHTVVDKYENAPGVINEDVVSFDSVQRFDLIVSVSTLEHVGWDETPRSPGKVLTAVENLRRLLAPGGLLLLTVPIGYNTELDNLLKGGRIEFSEQWCLGRFAKIHRDGVVERILRFFRARAFTVHPDWREVSWDQACTARYGSPFRFANAILVGAIRR